jgi:lysozyme
MTFAIRCGLLVLACSALLSGPVGAEENDASMIDGPSRAELFGARMKAEYGPSVVSNAIARPFVIPGDILGDAVYGIDVSHHNDGNCTCKAGQKCTGCKVNWARAARQKIGFAYIKTTQGTHFKDPTFDYHWRALARSGIARGAMHFMSADEDPIEQADHFVDKLQESGKLGPADLPPCLDLEADLRRDAAKKWIVVAESGEKLDFWKGQEPDEIMDKILRWLRRVEERTGRTPIVYTSRSWWRERIQDDKKFAVLKRYPIWIANYPESGRPLTDSPKVPNDQNWTLWHFADNAIMKDSGIMPGGIDISIFKGSLDSFRKTFGVSAPEPQQVALTDEPAESGQPGQQVASLTPPSQASDAQKSESLSASPAAETKKAAPQANANPNPPSESKPPAPPAPTTSPASATKTEPAADANKNADAGKLVQQATVTGPSSPPSAPPVAVQVAPPPPPAAQPPAFNKPADQTASINPGQQTSSAPPAAAPPAPPAAPPATTASVPPAKPPAPAVTPPPATIASAPPAANASPPPAVTPPAAPPAKPPVASAAASAAPPAPPPVSAPAAGGEKSAAGTKATPPAPATTSSSNSPPAPPAGQRLAQKTTETAAVNKGAEKTGSEKTEKTAPEKSMIEIELPNGRKLRFDANIDPAVLARLIAAIDK